MKKLLLLLVISGLAAVECAAQVPDTSRTAKEKHEMAMRKKSIDDSLRMEKLQSLEQYPLIKAGNWSGVIPVDQPTEVPDPNQDYKLLFRFVAKNPDSLTSEINHCLDDIVRILNLHVASGISPNRLFPVVIIQGGGIEAVMNNPAYRKIHSIDNPNLKVIGELEKIGTKFIVCGQAMAFQGIQKETLLPEVKISLTAKTVLSNYQTKGYVLYNVEPDK